jgi:hypothetical protein
MRKNKNILFAILFLVLGFGLFSQVTPGYFNRWINPNQKYFKIKIPKDGIYRLDSATLASTLSSAGISLNFINPKNIQLFHRGQEIYPYIAGENDGVFNKNDYILFYAPKNSCREDSLLYNSYWGTIVTPPYYLTNPYYSVINDSSTVFLTWNNSTNNLRLTLNTDTTYSSHNASPYYYKEVYTPLYDYSFGPLNSVNQSDPRYQLGEGFIAASLVQTVSTALTLPTAFSYTSGPQALFTICVSGANDIAELVRNDHVFTINYLDNLGTHPLTPVADTLPAYCTRKYNYAVNTANFGPNTSVVVTNLPNPNTSNTDNVLNVNYISAFYPHQFNMLDSSHEKIYLPDDPQGISELNITNFNGNSPVLIDVTNHRLLTVTASGSNFLSLVPNSGGNKVCYLADTSSITKITRILPVNRTSTPGTFANYFTAGVQDSVYIIVSHPKLMYTPGMHGVNDYKNWRTSGLGGGNYNVIVASSEDISDQFGYGVDNNPISIRNFCKFLIDTAIAASKRGPSNLFLMGKGIHPIDLVRGDAYAPSFYADKCMVPTWGNPAADILITQGLPGSVNLEPAIPTGRLAAQNDGDILSYLSKVELHETQSDDSLWKRKAIHFIGGNNHNDQVFFEACMGPCKNTFEDTLMGGTVYTFEKTTTAPTSVTTNDSVRQLINAGVSLITFFGHGSPTGFDENIDDPSTYNNSPRFPFVLANSCFTGDINSAVQLSHSEIFTLAPNNHGGIGYVATVTEGVANYLVIYSQEIYKQFAYKNYGKSYGSSMKNTIRQIISRMPNGSAATPNDTILIYTSLEMTLHGDPAVNSYGFTEPDYTLTNADVAFNTTKYADSIGIKIIMTNLGKAIKQKYVVSLQRNFPNGDTAIWYKNVDAPLYKDTLSFFIPLNYTKAVGKNDFFVTLDFGNLRQELSESNNTTTGAVSLFIKGSDIEPVWPYKYAIVPNLANVILKASTADPFAPDTVYRFQVDTSDAFSNLLVNTTVSAPGGVVSLPVTLMNKDSVVYFWRIRKDNDSAEWKESSFQVLTGKYGWGQSHFHQFKNDQYQYVKYNKPARRFDFFNTVNSITVKNAICDYFPDLYLNFTDVQFFYNENQERLWSCAPDGWSIARFDPVTAKLIPTHTANIAPNQNGNPPSPTYYDSLGSCICDITTMSVTDFGNYDKCKDYDPNHIYDYRDSLATFINLIPDSTPVLAYSVKYDVYNLPLNDTLKNAFHKIGSSQIDNLTDTTILIIFGKKGWPPGKAHEVISHTLHEKITLYDSLVPHFNNGYIASEIIGPCQNSDSAWGSLHWNFHHSPTDPFPSHDSIVVQLIGIDAAGHKTPIMNFPDTMLNVSNLSSYVDGRVYPYLQLIAYEADRTNNTPPQLTRWQVIFDQAPECAIHPPAGYSVKKNPVAEGEDYEVRFPIKNISDFTFNDSLLVTYSLQDAFRVNHPLPNKLKHKNFRPDSVIIDTVRLGTLGYSGSDALWIDVNPPGRPKYQGEQFHFNNIAQVSFDVNKDKINPMLDVTFDGIHILNGDIVSSKPVVLVSLKDENKFLALNDTSKFNVYLLSPGGTSEKRLNFNDNTLLFTPAQLPNNSCKINYHPVLTQDGKYTLHVYSKDRSNNVSGQFDYRIQFEVITKPSITEVLNYPNPFSTSTKFVFTVTGSEVPETFKIQIITITGKVVKEITREELGFIHIGRNITDYAWDGKDQYGDQLANGVYLYRVQTRLHDNEIDHMSTDADSYFKKGYGKMLLMR